MKIKVGDKVPELVLTSIAERIIKIPDPNRVTHLQFRRFSGCPICNLHLHQFIQNHHKLTESNIQEVALFHSSQQEMLQHQANAPFALIADPDKKLYKQFNVEKSFLSIFHPKAMLTAIHSMIKLGFKLPPFSENKLGLPADFLIDSSGTVLAVKYGRHADDQWSVDDVINLVKNSK